MTPFSGIELASAHSIEELKFCLEVSTAAVLVFRNLNGPQEGPEFHIWSGYPDTRHVICEAWELHQGMKVTFYWYLQGRRSGAIAREVHQKPVCEFASWTEAFQAFKEEAVRRIPAKF